MADNNKKSNFSSLSQGEGASAFKTQHFVYQILSNYQILFPNFYFYIVQIFII